MNVIPDYRAHRIEIAASPVVETVTCLKINATLAEQAGERWAKRWIDLGEAKAHP